MLQLMSGQMVSKETALAPMGIDAGEELRRIMDERSEQMQEEERFQREQQQKQLLQSQFEAPMQGAAMPGGGMAAGAGMPGGQAPTITPNDMMIQAEQEAQRLLAMDYSQRRSEMHKLKKANEQLHALVKSKIEEIRGSAQQQGGQMLLQDMAAQQGPAV